MNQILFVLVQSTYGTSVGFETSELVSIHSSVMSGSTQREQVPGIRASLVGKGKEGWVLHVTAHFNLMLSLSLAQYIPLTNSEPRLPL